MAIINIRQLPFVELVPIIRLDVDGIFDRVRFIGDDFVTTFLKAMNPPGSNELVAAPIAEVRWDLRSFTPNYLNSLLAEEKKRLARGRALPVGEVSLH